jgi:hypothetical protein
MAEAPESVGVMGINEENVHVVPPAAVARNEKYYSYYTAIPAIFKELHVKFL